MPTAALTEDNEDDIGDIADIVGFHIRLAHASVYRHFEDVEAFHEEIQRLRSQRALAPQGRRSGKREPGRDANRDQLPLLPPDAPGKSEEPSATPPVTSETTSEK